MSKTKLVINESDSDFLKRLRSIASEDVAVRSYLQSDIQRLLTFAYDFNTLADHFLRVVEGDDIPDGAYPLLEARGIVDENGEQIYEEDE